MDFANLLKACFILLKFNMSIYANLSAHTANNVFSNNLLLLPANYFLFVIMYANA